MIRDCLWLIITQGLRRAPSMSSFPVYPTVLIFGSENPRNVHVHLRSPDMEEEMLVKEWGPMLQCKDLCPPCFQGGCLCSLQPIIPVSTKTE